MKRQRLSAYRKMANVAGIVEGLDMFAGTGNGYAIQHFEEVEFQCIQNGTSSTAFWWQFRPVVKGRLRIAENLFNTLLCLQLLTQVAGVAFIGQRELVAQIVETVVDRR